MTGGSHGAHEERDVSPRPIVLAGLGIAVLLAVLGAVTPALMRYYAAREGRRSEPASSIAGRRIPPEPRLQAHPARDLRALRAEEDRLLTTYGWVDRQRGVVRIPIETAMGLLVERRSAGAGR